MIYSLLTYQNLIPKSNVSNIKQIVWETQKLHWNFGRPSISWFIDQNMQNIVLINNSESLGLQSFSDNVLHGDHIIFQGSVDNLR